MKIVIAADNCGTKLKEVINLSLQNRNIAVIDIGVHTTSDEIPYYKLAQQVAQKIIKQEADFGILCCWTGMGMAIVANKFNGIYAAVCESPFAAKQARIINNANVLALGEAITTPIIAKEILDAWLDASFCQNTSSTEQIWLEESMTHIAKLEKKNMEY